MDTNSHDQPPHFVTKDNVPLHRCPEDMNFTSPHFSIDNFEYTDLSYDRADPGFGYQADSGFENHPNPGFEYLPDPGFDIQTLNGLEEPTPMDLWATQNLPLIPQTSLAIVRSSGEVENSSAYSPFDSCDDEDDAEGSLDVRMPPWTLREFNFVKELSEKGTPWLHIMEQFNATFGEGLQRHALEARYYRARKYFNLAEAVLEHDRMGLQLVKISTPDMPYALESHRERKWDGVANQMSRLRPKEVWNAEKAQRVWKLKEDVWHLD